MSEFLTLPRNLQIRIAMMFLGVLIGSAVGPYMTGYYVTRIGALWTGILIVIEAIIGFLGNLYGGHLADVHGRKRFWTIGLLITVVGYFIVAVSNSPVFNDVWTTFLGFSLVTFGYSLADPSEEAMLIDSTNAKNRRFVYSINYWIINLAVIFGALLAGLFLRDHIFWLMSGMLIVAVINLAVVHFVITETLPESKWQLKKSSVFAVFNSYRDVIKDRPYLWYVIGSIGIGALFSQPDFLLSAHLIQNFKTVKLFGIELYGQRVQALYGILNPLIIVFSMGLVNRWMKKVNDVKGFTVGIIIFAIGMIGAMLMDTLTPLIIMILVFTLGEMIEVPSSQSLRAEMMNPKKIGAYSGLSASLRPVGNIVAGALVSLSGFVGVPGAAIVLTVIVAGSIVITRYSAKLKGLS
jgi:DHA1 family multidrug resistance protein B-like MFS transporter